MRVLITMKYMNNNAKKLYMKQPKMAEISLTFNIFLFIFKNRGLNLTQIVIRFHVWKT